MSFLKNLFSKTKKNQNQNQNQNENSKNLQIKFTEKIKTGFINHSPNGEKLEELWQKKLEISDEEAHLNWLFQFSILFLNSYQNWESIFKLTEIQNEMEKNLNKKKPKNQQIQKNKNSNIKMKEFAKNQESKFPIDSDLFHYAIEKDYAHPPELITEVLKTLTSLKNKLVSNMHKIFQLMDKKNSTKNIENINLLDFLELPSLEMLTILSRSEINRICLLKIGFAEEILEIGTIINTLFSHIVHSNIFFLDSGKDQDSGVLELSFQSTQNIFLVQYLVSTFLEIISNFFGIPIMNNINDMNKFPKLNLQIGNISWIFEMGLIDIILSFFDNIRKLRKRFLFNNLQYHIFFNLMNFILNIIQYPNLSRENLLRVFELVLNSFSPPIFNCPQIKILQLPISQNNKQNDENAYNFIQKTNYSILSSYSSSSKTNEDLLISQYLETTYDKIAKHFEFSLRYLILFYIAYIIKEYPFMEKLISKNIHTAKLCDFILWIVDSFRPKEIQYFIDQNSEKIQNLKIENTKLEKQKLFEQVSNSYKNEVFRTNLINDIEFIINNKRIEKEFFQDQLSFGRKLDQNQKKKYIQIESKIRDNSNNYIHEIFIVLQNILEISLSNAISGDKSNTPKNQGNEEVNPQNNIQNSESIHHHLFRVVLDLFDMNFHKSKINSQIRFLLKSISPDLQFEVLEFLIHLHRHTIHLINQNCWDLVFSDYFYIELNNAFIGFEETRLKLNEITKLSFQFICYSAIKDSKPNQEECTVLLNLIQKNKFNFNVVWQSLETLYEIFQNNFQATLKSLQNTHSYTIFSHMILEIFQYQSYQNFKNWQQKNQEEKNLPNLNVLEEQYQKIKGKENTLQILDKLFELLDLYFSEESSRKAIFMDRANPTCFIKSLLYGLLLSEKSEDYCLFQLNKIMLSIPENGDLSVCIMILNSFIEFVIQSFQKLQKTYSINQENSQNMGKCERYYKIIKSLIFSGILWIINNQQILQTLFANTGFFQMLATVLSFSKNEYSFIDIVLQILIELFRGNRENVIKFETEIGFETLARFIKQDHTEKTSQKTFDLIFEMIVGSNPINPNFQKEISQQKDEYFTFKNLSSNFTHEKFFANLQKNTKNEFSIQCPQAVPVIFDIFSPGITSTKVFQEFLKKFTEMCSNSIHNVSCCSEVGLLSQIIKLLPVIFENQEIVNGKTQDNQNIEKYMIELLGLIGSHSITVSELKSYVGLLRSVEDKFRSQNVSQILHALQIMFKLKYSENEMNPHTFFNFDGRTTFLELPKIQSWPAIRGFAFLTWMRIESLQDPLKKPNYEPRLFSFMNENSEGLELYLQSNEKLDDENWEVTQSSQLGIPKGNALQKQNLSQKSIHSSSKTISMNLVFKTSSTVAKDMACFNELKMEMKKWIFISVVHSSSKNSLGQECKVYIDGKLIGKLPMKFPTFNSELTHNRIGSNFAIPKSGILRENHFYGQMGAIYFFNDTLSAYQIEKIFKLGPDYLSSFEEQTTLQSNPENNSLRRTSSNQVISTIKNTANEQNQQNIQNYIPFSSNILHGSLSEKIFLNFNSKACNLNYCFDQSPNSLIVKARYFGMLKTVLLDFEDIIHCLGGIEILFPLFVQLDQPISSQENLKIYKKIEDLQNINDLKSSLNYEKILRPKKMIEELKPQFNSTEIQNGNYNEIENETKKLYQKLNFSVDTDASAQIFELIIDLLIRSTTNQDDMIRSNGFSIISYLFQSISPTHMTTQILKITKKFLLNIKRKELLESFIKDFILEFDNWILTDFAVQNKIIEKIIWRLLIHNENNRTGVDFSDLYNILRCYYWFSQETYSRGYDEKHHLITEKLLGFRPSKEQIQKLRFKILKILEYISLRNFTKKNIIQLILYCVEMKNISHLEEIKDVLFIIHKIIATNQECRKYDEEFSPFNSEEFSFDYNLEDSKNKNKNKNKNKKKKKKKDEKNEIPLNIIKNENENEDEDEDDDIDWDSDIEDNFLNINSCIVQTRKEKTRSIRDVELDNKQKIIESLETVGYFNPFIILLDTNQNEIREISLHIIYDLLHYSYFKLENKYKSQFDDVYILIHDILMKYTFTNQIRKTLFSILVLSQNELKAGYLFIRADGVLQTIFEDIANNIMLDENYQNLKSIFILLTKNEQNQKVFLNKKGWQIWLLDLLIKMNEKKKEKKAEEEKHLKLIEKLVHKFFSFLFGYYMQFQSDGWKTFEKVIFSIRTLPFDSFDDENKLMNRIFKNSIEICNTIFKQYNEIMVTSSNINTSNWKEVNIFFDNFCHTILCIISFLNIRTQFINENDEDDENENYEDDENDENENENNENQNEIQNQNIIKKMLEKSAKKRKFGSFRNWIDKDFVSERRKYGNEVVQFSIGIPDENSENMKQIILLMNLFSNFKFFLLFGKYCTYDQNVFRSGIQNIIHFLFGRIENLDMNVVEELMQFSQYLQSLVESIEIEVSHSRKTELLYVILSLLFTLLYEVEEYLQKDEKKNEEKQEQIKLQKIRLTKRKIIIEVLKLIFYKYYSLIQKKFTDPNGNSILNSEPSSFLLFQKNKEYEDFMELFQTEKWKNAVQQHFNSVEEKFRKELEIHWTIIAQERIAKTEGVKQEYQVIQENQEKQKQQKSDEILNQLLSTLVKESELNLKKYIDEKNKTKINARRKWRLMFRNLTSERGAWRQEKNHEEAHWKVDKTSGFSNQRRKLKRNYKFDMHMRACVRRDEGSKEYLTTILQNYDRTEMEKLRSETTLKILEMKSLIDNVNGKERLNETKIEFDDMMMIKESLKENNSKTIIYRTSCELVSLTGSISGMLEITTVSLDFYGKYNPYLKKGDLNEKLKEDEKMIEMTKYISWNLNEMKEMMKRRFNLRRCAIEFFLINKKSFLINFPNAKIADQVYNEISSMKLPNLIRYETGSFSEILKKSKITKKWQHYEMTNFEYLMELNIISGRTFNDISQYPVFPWILIDFSSEKIDLDDISVYRDLSKPIGALNEKRLKDFIQRYHDLSRIDDSIPPFHYGSHYSNQGGVLFYLIRIEPFTSLFIEMQGGKFDIADRVFHSLPTTWESCLTSQSDVKELIPEFYFFPEFLENSNNFNLGKKQTGELIGNVILPPWAKTPDEYIWMNRKALESEYVSQHLNEWIDLIFGYKQQGEEAVKAYNVFHYLTYENSIEIDSIQNEHQKQSIEEQVRYFGQTPTQIFKKPHPKRLSLSEVNASPFYWEIDAKTKFRSSCITLTKSKILFVNFKTKLIVFDKNRYLHFIRNFMNQPGINQTKAKHSPSLAISKSSYFPSRTFSQTNSNEKLESGFSSQTPQLKRKTLDLINPTTESKDDQYYSQISMETSIKKSTQRIGVSFAFGITQFSICFAVTKNEKNIIICGYWDNSFKIYNTETFKLKQSISHHKDIVTCLALDDDLLVTGSRDTTVIVWKLQVTKGKVLEKPMHILYGHNDEVSCVDVNYQLDVVVSGSLDGTCNIQTAQLGSYVRSFFLHESKRISPSMIKIINNGYILIYSNKDLSIYLFSINAKLLKIVDTSQIIHSWITSNNSQYLFTGSQQGVIQIRQIIDLKLVSHFEVKNSIRFLSFLGNEKNLLAGLESGELLFGKFF